MSGAEEFDKTLVLSKFALKLSGLRLNKPKDTIADYIKNMWVFYLNLFIFYTDIFAQFIWIFEKVQIGITFNEVTFIIPCVTYCLLGTMKNVDILRFEKHITHLINRLRELHPSVQVNDGNDQNTPEGKLNKVVKESMKKLNVVVTVLSYSNAATFSAFLFLPPIIMIYIYKTTGKIKPLYPILASYPYINTNDIRVWPALYLHHIWSGSIAISFMVGADTLLYAMCTFIHIQFKILGYRIETVIKRSTNDHQVCYGEVEIDDKRLRSNLKQIIRFHQELIALVLLVDTVYSKSNLLNFITSSLLICVTGFNLTLIKDAVTVVMFLSFLITCLSQVFILCYFGDMINRSSLDLCEAIYNSDWYLATSDVKKSMLIMIFRSQKSCKLTAFKFADVNLQSFTKVLSRSWSYFALLKTVYK